MKKLLILFSVLLVIFCGVWVFKSKVPVNRPEDSQVSPSEGWWQNDGIKPVAEEEWILDPEIPQNYIPVPGGEELYMVVDEDGKIESYREREREKEGSWSWKTVNPDIPANYEAVTGLTDIYKVTNQDGSVSYYRYVRNEDDTFAFVPTDKEGKDLVPQKPAEETSGGIPKNYYQVSKNVYAVYNEHGVVIGYKEKKVGADGKIVWTDTEKPKESSGPGHINPDAEQERPSSSASTEPIPENGTSESAHKKPDGTKVVTKTTVSTKEEDGFYVTRKKVVELTYSASGELLKTKSVKDEIVKKVAVGGNELTPEADPKKVKDALSEEYSRITTGSNLNFQTKLAHEVLLQIDAARQSANKHSNKFSNTDRKGWAQKLSDLRCADMAVYRHTSGNTKLYGDLGQMYNKYHKKGKGITDNAKAPLELNGKFDTGKSAKEIAEKLLGANNRLSTDNFEYVGLTIIQKDGYYIVDCVLFQKAS